jgi:hypothetical protein
MKQNESSQNIIHKQKLTSRHSLLTLQGATINNIMNYPVQFVSRALAESTTDRYEIVFAGRVVLTTDSLLIFELDSNNNAAPAFATHLSNVKKIKCGNLRSGHGNYTGGIVRIFGMFDRFVSERITLKIGLQYYQPLVAELKELLNGDGP